MIGLGILPLALAASPSCAQFTAGRPNFACLSDWQISDWIGFTTDETRSDVYMCQGLSRDAAMRMQRRMLGADFGRRRAATEALLQAGPPRPYDVPEDIVGTGHRLTPKYCRSIRFQITDLLRGQSELERRLRKN